MLTATRFFPYEARQGRMKAPNRENNYFVEKTQDDMKFPPKAAARETPARAKERESASAFHSILEAVMRPERA
jgi:hypothetical protein